MFNSQKHNKYLLLCYFCSLWTKDTCVFHSLARHTVGTQ